MLKILNLCLVSSTISRPAAAIGSAIRKTNNHVYNTMPTQITTKANWGENMEPRGEDRQIRKQCSDKFVARSITETTNQRLLPPSNVDQSMLYLIKSPQNLTDVNLPLGKDRVEDKAVDSLSLSNLSFDTYHGGYKKEDYVWLDPNGHDISPPGPDEYDTDFRLRDSSEEVILHSLASGMVNNIRKVSYVCRCIIYSNILP